MIIDAHLHLWNTGRHHYDWLQRPQNAALNRTFTFADFAERSAGTGVDRVVLVQADDDAADTEAMFEVAGAHEEIAGVVAWIPVDRPDEAAVHLDRLAARPKFAGVRTLIHDQPDSGWVLRPGVGEGLALLERRSVPFDVVAVLPAHLRHVPVLSARYPRLRLVLDHLANPPLGQAGWEPWRSLITEAARNPLVYAKVSGLYPPSRDDWDAADIRPFVEFAVGVFGADRLMFGSDWPVSQLAGGYRKVWKELSAVFDALSGDERDAILGGTARRCYGLE